MRHRDPPEADLASDAFLVEAHVADAMPAAHWHDHLELNWLEEGSMGYLLEGRRATLRPRRLGAFWAAVSHQTVAVEAGQRLHCAYLPLAEVLAQPLPGPVRAAILGGALVQAAEETPEDGMRLAAMAGAWDAAGPELRGLWREELLLRVRRLAAEPRLGPAPDSGLRSREARGVAQVERMTAFVRDHLSEPIDVAAVAAAAGLHPTRAQAAFRRVLGLSVGAYLRRQRASLAMRLLAGTDLGLAEVAHRAGYSSVQRLHDAFRAWPGRTPRRWREEARGR